MLQKYLAEYGDLPVWLKYDEAFPPIPFEEDHIEYTAPDDEPVRLQIG
jgi:hypothetical protein